MNRREFLKVPPAMAFAAAIPSARPEERRNGLGKFPVALWLAPAREHRLPIQEEINRLSNEHSVLPPFRAHATLCSGTIPDLGEALDHLLELVDCFCVCRNRMVLPAVDGPGKIAHRYRSERNSPKDAKQSSAWSTFLFLTLQPNDLFWEAENSFNLTAKGFELTTKTDVDVPDKKTLLPHISLAYCDPSNVGDIKPVVLEEQERGKLDFLKEVAFEGIEVVMPESGSWNDLTLPIRDRWDIVYTKQFKPPAYCGLRCVVAGGQVGVDQIALDSAQEVNREDAIKLRTGGWCPPKRETQPGFPQIPDRFRLQETPVGESSNSLGRGAGAWPAGPGLVPRSLRTEWNCRDSDGTLVVPATSPGDVGTVWTVRFAHEFKKPVRNCRVLQMDGDFKDEIEEVVNWLEKHNIEVLNVAGPAKIDSAQQTRLADFFIALFKRAAARSEK